MTLDEAIIHCEEVADRCDVTDGNIKCANEHRQLAGWLKDYKRLLKENEKNTGKDIAIAFQFGMALGFAKKCDEGDKIDDRMKNLISRQDVLDEIVRFSTEEGSSVECQQLFCNVYNMSSINLLEI